MNFIVEDYKTFEQYYGQEFWNPSLKCDVYLSPKTLDLGTVQKSWLNIGDKHGE